MANRTLTQRTSPASISATVAPAAAFNRRSVRHPILQLQQSIGNRSVQRLMEAGSNKGDLPGDLGQGSAVASSISEAIGSGGDSLDSRTRALMESRFGYDFHQVRIHTTNRAADSARAINAEAYTIGNNIVFGDGNYDPASTSGQKLIAHELTHVAQQGLGQTDALSSPGNLKISEPTDHWEKEAEDVSSKVLSSSFDSNTANMSVTSQTQSSPAVQCDTDDSAEEWHPPMAPPAEDYGPTSNEDAPTSYPGDESMFCDSQHTEYCHQDQPTSGGEGSGVFEDVANHVIGEGMAHAVHLGGPMGVILGGILGMEDDRSPGQREAIEKANQEANKQDPDAGTQ